MIIREWPQGLAGLVYSPQLMELPLIILLVQVEQEDILVGLMVRMVQVGRMQLTEDTVVAQLLKQMAVQA